MWEHLINDMATRGIYAIGLKQLLLLLRDVAKITECYQLQHGQPTT